MDFVFARVSGSYKIHLYSKRDLNPHAPSGARDFKSLVSTDSTIRARKIVLKQYVCCQRVQNYDFILQYPKNSFVFWENKLSLSRKTLKP